MRALAARAAWRAPVACCASARTPTTSRSAPAAPSCNWMAAGVRARRRLVRAVGAPGPREAEARASAADFLAGRDRARIEVAPVPRRLLSLRRARDQGLVRESQARVEPDVILTHRGDDAHQDHREVCRLTWNTFRDHLILEYEIPKWDGDLGRPNVYMPRQRRGAGAQDRAAACAISARQRSKHWFDAETFRGLARLRGMECRARALRRGVPRPQARDLLTLIGPHSADRRQDGCTVGQCGIEGRIVDNPNSVI